MDGMTTNEEDQREAAKLQARLRGGSTNEHANGGTVVASPRIRQVSIDEGAHKYVLISALTPKNATERQYFVVSQRGASYHRNVAEPFVDALERSAYHSIDVTGGGRISLDSTNKTISIYGYSYGFGLANHAMTKSIILNDERYKDFDVTWSNEGY